MSRYYQLVYIAGQPEPEIVQVTFEDVQAWFETSNTNEPCPFRYAHDDGSLAAVKAIPCEPNEDCPELCGGGNACGVIYHEVRKPPNLQFGG